MNIIVGGAAITKTIEGRETYTVRARYQRERRDSIEALKQIYIPTKMGAQVPLEQLAEIRFRPGPMVIKAEDTFLTSYVLFDKKKGYGEANVVERAQAFLAQQLEEGSLTLPLGVNYAFTGNYENQIRSQKTLAVILPLAMLVIFLLLYIKFKSLSVAGFIFMSIFIALSGGMILLYAYTQSWFLSFSIFGFQIDQFLFGTSIREFFNVQPYHLSVAVWVGFLALFGIASDDGVVVATYLEDVFKQRTPSSIDQIREMVIEGAKKRALPCMMTSATTIIALIPVLSSKGRGSDVMVPMAIPVFGGMLVVLITIFTVPVLYAWYQERKLLKSENILIRIEEAMASALQPAKTEITKKMEKARAWGPSFFYFRQKIACEKFSMHAKKKMKSLYQKKLNGFHKEKIHKIK